MSIQLKYLPITITSLFNPQKTHLKNPNFPPKIPFKFAKLRSKSNNDKLNEKIVVEDMENYLNSMSLEYDSVWDTKPSWCQPWTIGLTGVSVVAGSWLILHSVVVTVLASALISAWWYIFLFSYPKAYSDMIAERRERVSGGLEDTYGSAKNQ